MDGGWCMMHCVMTMMNNRGNLTSFCSFITTVQMYIVCFDHTTYFSAYQLSAYSNLLSVLFLPPGTESSVNNRYHGAIVRTAILQYPNLLVLSLPRRISSLPNRFPVLIQSGFSSSSISSSSAPNHHNNNRNQLITKQVKSSQAKL